METGHQSCRTPNKTQVSRRVRISTKQNYKVLDQSLAASESDSERHGNQLDDIKKYSVRGCAWDALKLERSTC